MVTPQCEQETHGEALPPGDLLLDRDAPPPTGYVFIRGVSVWKEGQTLRRALICLEIETHGKLPSPSGLCLFMAESETDLTWRDFLQRPEQPRRTVCSWPEVTCCRLWAPCAGLRPVVGTHSEHTGTDSGAILPAQARGARLRGLWGLGLRDLGPRGPPTGGMDRVPHVSLKCWLQGRALRLEAKMIKAGLLPVPAAGAAPSFPPPTPAQSLEAGAQGGEAGLQSP